MLIQNVRHDVRKRIMARSQSIVAYPPTHVYETETRKVFYDHCMEWSQKLRYIHHAITNFVEPIVRKAASGVLCGMNFKFYMRPHIDTSSYCAELTEQKVMLVVKRFSLTNEPCPRFYFNIDDQGVC